MFEATSLIAYIGFAALLIVTPGPAIMYIITRSVDQGRRAGIVSELGLATGLLFHVAAATLGVSAVLMASATAFHVVKWAGAVYLVVLGVRKLFFEKEADSQEVVHAVPAQSLRHIYYQGILVDLLNPKAALFFLAFLPQFVDPARGQVAAQSMVLGLIFVGFSIVIGSGYALVAGTAGDWLRRSRWFRRSQRYVAGSVYIGLGVTAALAGSDSH